MSFSGPDSADRHETASWQPVLRLGRDHGTDHWAGLLADELWTGDVSRPGAVSRPRRRPVSFLSASALAPWSRQTSRSGNAQGAGLPDSSPAGSPWSR